MRRPTQLDRIEANQGALKHLLERIVHELLEVETMAEVTQADVDAISGRLGDLSTSLVGVHDELATGIKNLEDQIAALPPGTAIDITALSAAVDNLGTVKDSLKAEADAVPQPTPPPAP